MAYGLILPEAVLQAPKFGCFNLHASRLPRWRGAAPIQRAIMAGDKRTAVMIMHMDKGLDTGPICLARDIAIAPNTTAGDLHDILSKAGAEVMVAALTKLQAGDLSEVPQSPDGVTYAAKITKAEARIDFTRSVTDAVNHIHGLSPFPGAWFEVDAGGKPERIKVLRAALGPGAGRPGTVLEGALTIACGSGAIALLEVQRAGKRPVSAAEFLRGFRLKPDTQLT